MGLAFWRSARTPAGFAGGVALTLLLFFAFAKQAFCNYYYLTLCGLCCALAASGGTAVREPVLPCADRGQFRPPDV